MTNVFISIDMEGIAGIAHRKQVTRGIDDYQIGRELMTGEANAAIAGAFDAGATSVVVNDSHGDMFNLIPEQLDARAELILGTPKVPMSMMQGFGPEFDIALFLGYHAAAGTEAAVLDHTYYGRLLYDVRINGESWTEASLNAGVAGSFGVPVGLVTGDDKICAQAEKQIPGVRTLTVKQSHGRGVARTMHPSAAREAIKKTSAEVVGGAGDFEPFVPEPPFVLEADVLNTGIAELCALAPFSERVGPRTVRFETHDFIQAFRCLIAWTYLGESEAPRYAGT
jgi:D-amino peptidase